MNYKEIKEMCKFRNLRADEIDARVQSFTEKGAILLLYKDARCDMNILDEAVGQIGWQREHYECKGNLFCRVGIKFHEEWIWKSDCGAESNTEKEKGEASDSFKRACFNWGIGRELYTSPFIFISLDKINTYKDKNGKTQTRDKFSVVEIDTSEDKQIKGLIIKNDSTNQIVFTFRTLYNKNTGSNSSEKKTDKEIPITTLNEVEMTYEQALDYVCELNGKTIREIYHDKTLRATIPEIYKMCELKTKKAFDIVRAEIKKHNESKN